ncbi:hypothetical protein HELRODRAFT_179054 [Helobdella robusta]|uniref:Uncharacterized protein n=1 Tax=Helobdella robusta TaxID=6412 RepID=T1FE42_HELRO|nr:hypothetical protein HELRODRAFT_179054 [Helobdella robusta]ESN95861.1 hypothetical protein HELRODRAFT_179054 [Helobdella robusta]
MTAKNNLPSTSNKKMTRYCENEEGWAGWRGREGWEGGMEWGGVEYKRVKKEGVKEGGQIKRDGVELGRIKKRVKMAASARKQDMEIYEKRKGHEQPDKQQS